MKPAPFEYVRPATVQEAVRLLASTPNAKVLAGGQTLGPMLNLRLAQPPVIVDIGRIAELAEVAAEGEAVTIGATVTHASIEDGRIEDPTNGFLPRVARGIAYRAVRTRGTIGGSLAHADPAADWLSALTALGAEVVIAGPGGRRRQGLDGFVRGAMQSDLGADEVVVAVRIPRFSQRARFGFHKICRKTGEFAEAIGVVADDPERGVACLLAGATGGKPVIMRAQSWRDRARFSVESASDLLRDAHYAGDAYDLKLHAVAMMRACDEAFAS